MLSETTKTRPFILGLGGTLRPDSSTERALVYALHAATAAGADTSMLTASDLSLPLYNPDAPDPSSEDFLRMVSDADGLIIASPAYHGGPSGWMKNALDYLEGLRNHERPYLDHRAVGCIVCASGTQAPTTALVSLRSTIHSLRGWPTPLGVVVDSLNSRVNGVFQLQPATCDQLEILAMQVVMFARTMRYVGSP